MDHPDVGEEEPPSALVGRDPGSKVLAHPAVTPVRSSQATAHLGARPTREKGPWLFLRSCGRLLCAREVFPPSLASTTSPSGSQAFVGLWAIQTLISCPRLRARLRGQLVRHRRRAGRSLPLLLWPSLSVLYPSPCERTARAESRNAAHPDPRRRRGTGTYERVPPLAPCRRVSA